jgi:hypothetical protein
MTIPRKWERSPTTLAARRSLNRTLHCASLFPSTQERCDETTIGFHQEVQTKCSKNVPEFHPLAPKR